MIAPYFTEACVFWELFPEIRFPADLALFKRLCALRHPAYKYELARGMAELTPEPQCGRALLRLAEWSRPASRWNELNRKRYPPIRVFSAADWSALPHLLRASHAFDLPFAALDEDAAAKAAKEYTAYFRRGGEGELVKRACYVAQESRSKSGLLGAIFVTLTERRKFFWPSGDESLTDAGPSPTSLPHLTWIMVRSWEQRRGIGVALLERAIVALRELGYATLASTFLIGNVRAMLWHWRNGFELLPE